MNRPGAPVLAVERLSLVRGGVRILRAITWRVQPGEHWVILGANGSGKTSLLSAITGYLTPTAGEILLLGKQYGHADWSELRRHVGLVSSAIRQEMADDEPALESVISGKYGMIDLWRKISPADRREATRLLRWVECGYLAARPWRVLSQGERQRVLIGRALMAQPRVLILDEPCAGLDPAAREHFLQFLQRLGRRRHSPTLIFVTHHVEEIMPAFSHVLLLQAGQVLGAGEKSKVLTTAQLAAGFGVKLKLTQANRRFSLQVSPDPSALL